MAKFKNNIAARIHASMFTPTKFEQVINIMKTQYGVTFIRAAAVEMIKELLAAGNTVEDVAWEVQASF